MRLDHHIAATILYGAYYKCKLAKLQCHVCPFAALQPHEKEPDGPWRDSCKNQQVDKDLIHLLKEE